MLEIVGEEVLGVECGCWEVVVLSAPGLSGLGVSVVWVVEVGFGDLGDDLSPPRVRYNGSAATRERGRRGWLEGALCF